MAALKPDVKAFIIQSLACFDTPTLVVESVQKEFGLKSRVNRLNLTIRQRLAASRWLRSG